MLGQVRNKMTTILTLPWYYSQPQSLSVMNQISPFSTSKGEADSPTWNTQCPYFPTSPHQLTLGVNNVWLRQKTRTSIKHKIDLKAKLLPWQQNSRCHFGAKFVWAASLQYFQGYPWFCDLSLYGNYLWCHQFLNKNLNISGTREDISEMKMPLFVTLKGLSNKHI